MKPKNLENQNKQIFADWDGTKKPIVKMKFQTLKL